MTTSATLGVAHPPGYPLLVLLGHIFTWLPIGPLPFRMNLVAVVSNAATVGIVFCTARRIGASRLAAAVAAVVLGCNPLFWEWSLAIEAFPLNNVVAASLVYFLVRWESEPDRRGFLTAAAFCGGIGTSNHLTIVFLIPAVLVVLWRRRSYLDGRTVGGCIVAIALGLVPYLYIPWAASRDPYLNWGSVSSAHDLVRHFLRSDYGTGRLVAQGAPPGSPLDRLSALVRSFTLVEAILVVVGAEEGLRRRRWFVSGIILSAALAGPAFAAYANMDVSSSPILWAFRRFLLLPNVLMAPLAGLGVAGLADLVKAALPQLRGKTPELAVAGCAVAASIATVALRFESLDQSHNHVAHTFAQDLLATLDPNSVLLATGDEVVFPVAYVQAVERSRPDVTLVMLGLLRSYPWYTRQLRHRSPAITIPFDRYDPATPTATLRALRDANPSRPFAVVGSVNDPSLSGKYWLYHRGLVDQIEPMSTDIGLQSAAEENDRLLHMYRLPDPLATRMNTFEISYIAKYADGPRQMGDQFASAHLDTAAAGWYRRALAIYPDDDAVRQALARLGGTQPR